MTHHVQRVAHRGGSALAPQNTMAAFRNALTLPVDAVELDVQMSRDGHVIVFHDTTVERLTNGVGNVLDLDFAYLRGLNAAAHFPGGWQEPQQIPTLREVLDLARDHLQVYIEIKMSKRGRNYGRYPHIAEAVVEEVCSAGMIDQVVIISFDWLLLPTIKSLEPGLRTGAIVSDEVWDRRAEDALHSLVRHILSLECNWINMDCDLFTQDMPHIVHEHGLKLGVWTVNSEHELRRFAAAGVDSITSDRPDLFAGLGM